jgi:phosphatidylinositol glycan class V
MTGYTTVVEKYPRILLVLLFSAWKILLLAITLFSPGPDYDTSTQLLFNGHGTWNYATVPQVLGQIQSAGSPLSIERLVERLTRWDAIYFVPVAERGYVHEQEWAFGWGFTRLLSLLSKSMFTFYKHQVFHRSCPSSVFSTL